MLNVKVFGCKVNKYFAEKWKNQLMENAVLQEIEQKEIEQKREKVLIASCVVTDKAKKKWVKAVLDACKKHATVYLTGCGVFDHGKVQDEDIFYKLYPELALYKKQIIFLGENPEEKTPIASEKQGCNVLTKKSTEGKALNQLTTRKFLVVQTGCDSFCTFCLTIHKRGSHQSRPIHEILEEIRSYEQQGGKEIVLTGINVGARGASTTTNPKESQLAFLLQEILQKTAIPRIRISSIGPEFLNNELLEVFCNTRILPYFHLSIQSFSDAVLVRMKRNYTKDHLDFWISRLRLLPRPDREIINIGADILVGFPGETEEDFAITHQSIITHQLTQLHVFPFSSHEIADHVPAKMLENHVPEHVKNRRARTLREVGKDMKNLLRKKTIGHPVTILLEQKKGDKWFGWTENYIPVKVNAPHAKKNDLLTKKLEKEDILTTYHSL